MKKLITRFFIVAAIATFIMSGLSGCTEETIEPGSKGGVADDGIGR